MSHDTLLKQTSVMTLALCTLAAGGWSFGLAHLHRSLHDAERTIRTQEELRISLGRPTPDAPRRTDAYRGRIADVRRVLQSTPPADELYDAIQKSAAASGVVIERLEPQSTSRRTIDLTKNAGFTVEPVAFELQAKGDLPSVIAFTDAMERTLGLSRLNGLKVLPAADATRKRPTVVLHLTSTHFVATASPDAVAAAPSGRQH